MSQSLQVAPFDYQYQYNNKSNAVEMYDSDVTLWNSYLGGVYQQAVSALTYVPNDVYTGTSGNFNMYGECGPCSGSLAISEVLLTQRVRCRGVF